MRQIIRIVFVAAATLLIVRAEPAWAAKASRWSAVKARISRPWTARGEFKALLRQNPSLKARVYKPLRQELDATALSSLLAVTNASMTALYSRMVIDPANSTMGAVFAPVFGGLTALAVHKKLRGERLTREVVVEVARQSGIDVGSKAGRKWGTLKWQNEWVQILAETLNPGPLPPFPSRATPKAAWTAGGQFRQLLARDPAKVGAAYAAIHLATLLNPFISERQAREIVVEVANQSGVLVDHKADVKWGSLARQNARVEEYLEEMKGTP